MVSESAVGVGIVAVVLVVLVRSGLLQWALDRLKKAAPLPPAGGPSSSASPVEAAPVFDASAGMPLDELAKLFMDRKARIDGERNRAEEILKGKPQ